MKLIKKEEEEVKEQYNNKKTSFSKNKNGTKMSKYEKINKNKTK